MARWLKAIDDVLKVKVWHLQTGRITNSEFADWVDKQPTIDPVKQEWISVKDRLPTKEDGKNSNGAVIAIEKHEGYAKRWDYGIVADYAVDFLCWMPFPEPPKDGEQD